MCSNFIFTSAGDNTSFYDIWVAENQNYDIYVMYYGENEENYNLYKSKVKFIEKRKGSKFQNFLYFYSKYPDIINSYKYFFILDDDIVMDVKSINMMFSIAIKYDLLICAPSFVHPSKISHRLTQHKPNVFLTYTNFVEVNTPLFNKTALDRLMNVLDPTLIGWGIDYLYIWANGLTKKKAYAIIHYIKCINPKDNAKKYKNRELTLLPNCSNRAQIWGKYAHKVGCPSRIVPQEHAYIFK